MVNRRDFIKKSAIVTGGLAVPPVIPLANSFLLTNPVPTIKISEINKPLAIAMWDYSWILRHHRFGEFEDWDKVLEELAERGYNAIRIDVMPQFVAADADGKIQNEFRSIKKDWKPALWGNNYPMSFNPRDALLEFLPKCKQYGIKVGLATWFMRHGTEREDIFMEEGGLLRAWDETLSFLDSNDLLENVIYVDLLNEYPNWHGYDWFKNEMNKRSDVKQFILDNPDANVPDQQVQGNQASVLKQNFYNDFINKLILKLKSKHPGLDYFASLDSGMNLDNIDLSNFNALDYHIWFAHTGKIPGLGDVSSRDIALDYRKVYSNITSYWKENKASLVDWMDSRITKISSIAAKNDLVCGNTEGWGPIWWFDHPDLDWKWVKESADICVDLALQHDNYKFICSSNFTHPQFKGMWEDITWHKRITTRIKNLMLS